MAAGCMSMHSGPASQYFISSIAFFLKKNLSLYWICCYIASVLCREPAQAIPPRTRSCGRELLSKASELIRPPRLSPSSTAKPESVCFTILWLSPTLLTLTRVYSWPPFSGENQLRAISNKSPAHERNISYQTPSVSIIACSASIFRPLQLCIWFFASSQLWEAWKA